MGKTTSISWTDSSFSPWWGCTKVSPGCANCYAEALSARFGGDVWGVGKARRRTKPATWREPLKWDDAARKEKPGPCDDCGSLGGDGPPNPDCMVCHGGGWKRRPRVFCASMADVFDGEVPVQWRTDLFTLVGQCQHLEFLLLTKRPENLAAMLPWMDGPPPASMPLYWHDDRRPWSNVWLGDRRPWSNVWLGVSVEDQRRADERIPALLAIPAAVYFLSVEPQLEHVTLPPEFLALGKRAWAIVGGESGPSARPFNPSWARSLVKQCANAQVPCFVKQLGSSNACAHDKKGGCIECMPADLRVRQWPEVSSC